MDILTGITLAVPAGVNAYIPLLAVALSERMGWVTLRQPFEVMGEWWFIALVAVLLAVELVADKVPAVDHVNDLVQTFVRPAAGGLMAVASSGEGRIQPWLLLAAGVIIAGGVHAVKASARPVINAATGGAGAPVVSTAEDVGAAGVSFMAIAMPVITFLLVASGMVFVVWRIHRWRERRAAGRAAEASAEEPASDPDDAG